MGCKENAVLRLRALTCGQFIELLQGMNFAMPERIFHLIIGIGDHQRQIIFSQDRGPEQLVAQRHTSTRQRYNILLDNIEQAPDQGVISLVVQSSIPD